MRRATRCFGRGSPSPCATRLPKLSCHEEHAGSCPLCENSTASTTVERCDILIVRRVCAGFASSGFKATALTDNERERGESDHAGQYGVPSSEAQFRLPAHRVRSIPCPHAPSPAPSSVPSDATRERTRLPKASVLHQPAPSIAPGESETGGPYGRPRRR